MRAMPSPVDRTTPVSRTSRLFSYSRICSRMMSLISAARICMTVVPPDLSLTALGHLSAHSGQLRAEAPVPDRAADVQHDPAEQLQAAVVGEELHEVADVARDTERRHDLADDPAPRTPLDGGIQHHGAQPRLGEGRRGGG